MMIIDASLHDDRARREGRGLESGRPAGGEGGRIIAVQAFQVELSVS